MIKKLTLLAIGCAALSACVETTSTPEVQRFMTQEELLATLPGETVYGVSSQDNETEWQQTYSEGGTSGTIAVIWDGEESTSEWSVQGDKWCEDWGSGSACFNLVKVNDKELIAFRDGSQTRNPWYIK